MVSNPEMTLQRVGLVGCGTVVQQNYVKSLRATSGIRVTHVTDRDMHAASVVATAFGAKVVTEAELRGFVDGVIVATPPSAHFAIVRDSLETAKIVICEKPFVGTRVEAEALVALAAERKRKLLVGHLRRTFAAIRLARDLVSTGVIGDIRRIKVAEGARFTWVARSGYVSSDRFGGVLYDTGSHSLDVALFISGLDMVPFEIAVRDVARDQPEPSHEFRAKAELRGPAGEIDLDIALSRRELLANYARFEGDRGSIDVPLFPGVGIRLWGPHGSTIIEPSGVVQAYDDCFVQQWTEMLGSGGAWRRYDAARFVGLVSLLQALGDA